HARVVHSQLATLPECGHRVQRDDPQAFRRVAEPFLETRACIFYDFVDPFTLSRKEIDRMPEPSLLVTKFTIPPVRARLLPRRALIERLNQSCALPLVLLSAGAGFGKTTLLAAWASQYTHPVAWLTLDPLDNDPQRFWSAVVTALRTRFPT